MKGLAAAGLWTSAGRLVGKVIDLASLLVLARLLSPADFGLVSKALIVVTLIEAITDLPLQQPLYRVAVVTRDQMDTAFTLGITRGLIIALLTIASAPFLARLYEEPRLVSLLAFLMLWPIFRGISSPEMAKFGRKFDLRPDFVSNVVSKVGSLLSVVVLAIVSRSYWAIAVGTVVNSMLLACSSFILAPYRPRLSLRAWDEFSDIIGWSLFAQVLAAFNFQSDRIILGRSLSEFRFGQYSVSSDLSGVPFQALMYPMTPILTRIFATADEREAIQSSWLLCLNATLLCVGPTLLGAALLADFVVPVALGRQWGDAADVLAILCLSSLPNLIGHSLNPFVLARYDTRRLVIRAAVELVVKLSLTLLGLYYVGLYAAIAARGVAGLASALYALTAVRNGIGLPVRTQARSLWRTVVGLLIFSLVCWLLGQHSSAEPGGSSTVLLAFELMAILVTGIVSMLAAVLACWWMSGKPDGLESRMLALISSRRMRKRTNHSHDLLVKN